MAIGISKVVSRDVNSGIFDVVDAVDPDLVSAEGAWIKAEGGDPILMYAGETVNLMISRLLDRTAKASIKLLRIHGHGRPGLQGIANGNNPKPAPLAAIGVYNFDKIKNELSRLNGAFSMNAEVYLMGCNVAQGKKGKQLLESLANVWRVPITAGVKTQWSCGTEAPVDLIDICKAYTFSHEGPTETAYPK